MRLSGRRRRDRGRSPGRTRGCRRSPARRCAGEPTWAGRATGRPAEDSPGDPADRRGAVGVRGVAVGEHRQRHPEGPPLEQPRGVHQLPTRRGAPAQLEEGLEAGSQRSVGKAPALAFVDRGQQPTGIAARAGRRQAVEAREEAGLVGGGDHRRRPVSGHLEIAQIGAPGQPVRTRPRPPARRSRWRSRCSRSGSWARARPARRGPVAGCRCGAGRPRAASPSPRWRTRSAAAAQTPATGRGSRSTRRR